MQFRIGPLMDPPTVAALTASPAAAGKFRARCHLLGAFPPLSVGPDPVLLCAVGPPGDAAVVAAEAATPGGPGHLLFEQGNYRGLTFRKNEAPQLFSELARVREITCREAGQGSGHAVTITPEDGY